MAGGSRCYERGAGINRHWGILRTKLWERQVFPPVPFLEQESRSQEAPQVGKADFCGATQRYEQPAGGAANHRRKNRGERRALSSFYQMKTFHGLAVFCLSFENNLRPESKSRTEQRIQLILQAVVVARFQRNAHARIKGHFSQGISGLRLKHTFVVISELFVRPSFGMKLEPSRAFVCFFLFSILGFCTISPLNMATE